MGRGSTTSLWRCKPPGTATHQTQRPHVNTQLRPSSRCLNPVEAYNAIAQTDDVYKDGVTFPYRNDYTTKESPSHANVKMKVRNVRGAGNREFLNTLKEHICMQEPHVVSLLETHINGTRGHYRVEAQGFQGGIWVLWNTDKVNLTLVSAHQQFIIIKVKMKGTRPWLFAAIYVSPTQQLRKELWAIVIQFAHSTESARMLVSDYNKTRSLDERDHGGHDMNKRCILFANWIENNGLIDLGFLGPRFTWVRGNTYDTSKSAKLDRALCNMSWRSRFPEGSVRHLIWCYSDHCSILISTNGFAPLSKNAKRFRFEVAWTSHTQCKEFPKSHWKENLPLV
ncbi:hypothetical protein Cgig2_021393 [Carnegiea gigantea]|uniref:Endonuclease/exonuclease/phosphatase domain-containing protein n=1 Tax=Carnegiea gigantea TaxID=171969 RepID=A0A9Q1GXA0_9CARY|nr:hypothetical protein Cgig2_021393 [Carnegiea gigantea]